MSWSILDSSVLNLDSRLVNLDSSLASPNLSSFSSTSKRSWFFLRGSILAFNRALKPTSKKDKQPIKKIPAINKGQNLV